MVNQQDCVFCKIVSGEIPSYTVYEDEQFKAILDISPSEKGHVIILPKNHAANIVDLPVVDASQIFVVAKKIATALLEAYFLDGVNILQNNGEAAGQTVYHLHVHVIPRYKEDTVTIKWAQKHLEKEDFEQVAEQIKGRL